jgi:Na+-driven multidrug efflux pump
MATGLVVVLVRHARRAGATLHPHPGRVLRAALTGIPLLVRTLALRAVLLLTTWVAAGLGDVPLAAYQVSATVWSFLAFALDALAIAAQALTGRALGAGDVAGARSATALMVRWGLWGGAALGVLVLAVHRVLPALFTEDPAVRAALAAALVVVALGQPLSGYVFVVDGVLIGAGDGRWLARAMAATFVIYAPLAVTVHVAGDRLLTHGAPVAVAVLWAVFTIFMAIRGLFFHRRVGSDAWAVTGASR